MASMDSETSSHYSPQKVKTDYDPATGITEEFWYAMPKVKDGPGRVTIRRLQDVEGILDENGKAFNSHGKIGYSDTKGAAHMVARIPDILVEKWMREGFNWYESTDNERRAKLNDPDYKKLLVRPGKL
jgi:hypothetical protein